ncbi:MAG: ATPase P [Pseudomonadota bacterium]
MIELTIPGFAELTLERLILDFNGVLAVDGEVAAGVADLLRVLAPSLALQVITADTHGTCRDKLAGLPVEVHTLGEGPEDLAKLRFLEKVGPESSAALGNGRNDRLMLARAALGVAVLGEEGAASSAIVAADITVPGIIPALELFLKPLRIKAGLRV